MISNEVIDGLGRSDGQHDVDGIIFFTGCMEEK